MISLRFNIFTISIWICINIIINSDDILMMTLYTYIYLVYFNAISWNRYTSRARLYVVWVLNCLLTYMSVVFKKKCSYKMKHLNLWDQKVEKECCLNHLIWIYNEPVIVLNCILNIPLVFIQHYPFKTYNWLFTKW